MLIKIFNNFKILGFNSRYNIHLMLISIIFLLGFAVNGLSANSDLSETSNPDNIFVDQKNINNDPKDPATELQLLLRSITFINANFSQYVINKSGAILQEQTGNIKLKKPNLLNWRVLSPDPSQIIIDGNKIWQYDEDLEQVIVKKIDQGIKTNPLIQLLLNDFSLDKTGLTVGYAEENCAVDRCFILHNYNANLDQISGLIKILFGFDRKQQLVLVKLIDQLEQTTVFNFRDFRKNIGSQAFKFSIPNGVEVIEDTA